MTRLSNALLYLPLLLAGCSSISSLSLWPFGSENTGREPGPPPNSTEYRCNGGKTFYVRMLAGGDAWVIYPDRQVRLEKAGETRYTNGIATLRLDTPEATLDDGPAISYSGCTTGTRTGG
jgi:hypothetical protein